MVKQVINARPFLQKVAFQFIGGFFFIIIAVSCRSGFNPENPGTGVAYNLARYRESDILALHYELCFDIPESRTDPVEGHLSLHFVRKSLSDPFVLDFRGDKSSVLSLNLNGKPQHFELKDEHILVNPGSFVPGKNCIEINFVAGDLSLNRNDDYLYTLLVPDRARTVFPCLDQPGLKAVFSLKLNIPSQWKAVSNTPIRSITRLDENRNIFYFEETPPLPVYLFAFAAGRFDTISFQGKSRTIVLYHRETDKQKIISNYPAINQIVDSSLCFMEQYTGIKYPFPKYDLVAIPSFQYGGMEHPGCIFFNASRIFLSENPASEDLIARANLIAHETAHIWFGDYVTMPWFDEVWMKEVFAGFMADKITGRLFPRTDFQLKFLLTHYPASYDIDRTPVANPVWQKLENLNKAGSLYGNIIYHKAPIAIMQLEKLAGETQFRNALAKYLAEHPYGTAGWNDLIIYLSGLPMIPVKDWSVAWMQSACAPEVSLHTTAENGKTVLHIFYNQHKGICSLLPQFLQVSWWYQDHSLKPDSIFLMKESSKIFPPETFRSGTFPLPNPDGSFYGIITPDQRIIDSCFALLHDKKIPAPLTRASLWIMLYENLVSGRINPEVFLENIMHALQSETEPLLSAQLQKYLIRSYWQLIPSVSRKKYNRSIEKLLWNTMQSTDNRNKRTFFFTWLSVMESDSALKQCRQLLDGKLSVRGFIPDEKDRNRIALELALRDTVHWKEIITERIVLCKNPDEKAKMAFILPALSPAVADRDSFFISLAKPAAREHEPWVLTAIASLHHPLRQNISIKYLRSSLEMLEDIRNTNDIFFPERWLEACFSMYNSPGAVEVVNEFLKTNPHYPSDLKAKILQQTDMAFRAVQIMKRYYPNH